MYHEANESAHEAMLTMFDSLTEHDPDDPNLGDASHWPWWCDQFTLELGPDPTFDPLPDDDLDDLRVEF